jgi:hypothetical protein
MTIASPESGNPKHHRHRTLKPFLQNPFHAPQVGNLLPYILNMGDGHFLDFSASKFAAIHEFQQSADVVQRSQRSRDMILNCTFATACWQW